MKNSNKNVFMTTLTTLGMFLGIVVSLILLFVVEKYYEWSALIILALALIFRVIGYIFDRIIEKK